MRTFKWIGASAIGSPQDVLKAYSTELIGRGAHSLFYPGGVRGLRTGALEAQVKQGLLGTAIAAWQEGLAVGRSLQRSWSCPVTLSCSLVLEAETLIEDALAASGKSRYIISDDEFSEPKTVLRYVRRMLDMDASVVVRFGAPWTSWGMPSTPTAAPWMWRGAALRPPALRL